MDVATLRKREEIFAKIESGARLPEISAIHPALLQSILQSLLPSVPSVPSLQSLRSLQSLQSLHSLQSLPCNRCICIRSRHCGPCCANDFGRLGCWAVGGGGGWGVGGMIGLRTSVAGRLAAFPAAAIPAAISASILRKPLLHRWSGLGSNSFWSPVVPLSLRFASWILYQPPISLAQVNDCIQFIINTSNIIVWLGTVLKVETFSPLLRALSPTHSPTHTTLPRPPSPAPCDGVPPRADRRGGACVASPSWPVLGAADKSATGGLKALARTIGAGNLLQ